MKYSHFIICLIISLLFPFAGRAANNPDWNCDIHAFQYDMSVYLVLRQENKPMTGNLMVAAFVGDECRGIAEVQSAKGTSYYYLRVRSNELSGDSVYFKVYDQMANKELVTSGSLSFENLRQVGYPSQPWVLILPIVIDSSDDSALEGVDETTENLQLTGIWTEDKMVRLIPNL